MKVSVCLLSSVCCFALVGVASAETPTDASQTLSYQSFLSSMGTAGGDSTVAWEVAPSYSELFGLGVRSAVGTQLSDWFALGAIIDIAEHREEYLANAGVQLNDSMRIVATAGLLKEREEFVLGEGRESVQQYEYGLSLKGNYDAGVVRGFEVNAYQTNGSSDTDTVETGDLTGLQIVTQLQPSERAAIRIGAGYERAEWEGGDVDQGFTLQAIGSLEMSDALSLNYAAKSAETENTYGVGLTYDMSTPDLRNSSLSVGLNRIEGKHGISDDTRVALNWTIGLGGAASDATMSSMGGMPSVARKDLLAEVMTRPAFLPERVIARGKATTGTALCSSAGVFVYNPFTDENDYFFTNPEGAVAIIQGTPEENTFTIDGVTFTALETVDGLGTLYFPPIGFLPSYIPDQTYTLIIGEITCQVRATAFIPG